MNQRSLNKKYVELVERAKEFGLLSNTETDIHTDGLNWKLRALQIMKNELNSDEHKTIFSTNHSKIWFKMDVNVRIRYLICASMENSKNGLFYSYVIPPVQLLTLSNVHVLAESFKIPPKPQYTLHTMKPEEMYIDYYQHELGVPSTTLTNVYEYLSSSEKERFKNMANAFNAEQRDEEQRRQQFWTHNIEIYTDDKACIAVVPSCLLEPNKPEKANSNCSVAIQFDLLSSDEEETPQQRRRKKSNRDSDEDYTPSKNGSFRKIKKQSHGVANGKSSRIKKQ